MIKIGKRWIKEDKLTTEDKIKLGLEKPKEVREEKPKFKKKFEREGK